MPNVNPLLRHFIIVISCLEVGAWTGKVQGRVDYNASNIRLIVHDPVISVEVLLDEKAIW